MANKKLNFLPTRDWLVLPLVKKSETESGIILTGSAKKSLQTNILKVLAAGPECLMVKENDTVMVHPNTEGLVITIDKRECIMVNEFSICGVIPV
tara:strand:+ start:543 stop:827 length:285 start_codon:yes stop_codon:yes gene_type:complete